jgi:hypothetical protein
VTLARIGATDVSHASWGSSVPDESLQSTDEPDGTSVAPNIDHFSLGLTTNYTGAKVIVCMIKIRNSAHDAKTNHR